MILPLDPLQVVKEELRLRLPAVWSGGREESLGCLAVEAARNSIAKLGIVGILVGALWQFTVSEGGGAHVQDDSPATPPPPSYV